MDFATIHSKSQKKWKLKHWTASLRQSRCCRKRRGAARSHGRTKCWFVRGSTRSCRGLAVSARPEMHGRHCAFKCHPPEETSLSKGRKAEVWVCFLNSCPLPLPKWSLEFPYRDRFPIKPHAPVLLPHPLHHVLPETKGNPAIATDLRAHTEALVRKNKKQQPKKNINSKHPNHLGFWTGQKRLRGGAGRQSCFLGSPPLRAIPMDSPTPTYLELGFSVDTNRNTNSKTTPVDAGVDIGPDGSAAQTLPFRPATSPSTSRSPDRMLRPAQANKNNTPLIGSNPSRDADSGLDHMPNTPAGFLSKASVS